MSQTIGCYTQVANNIQTVAEQVLQSFDTSQPGNKTRNGRPNNFKGRGGGGTVGKISVKCAISTSFVKLVEMINYQSILMAGYKPVSVEDGS